jgi:TetR/AcrR family transcriptional regulator, tetracycline repressor protein
MGRSAPVTEPAPRHEREASGRTRWGSLSRADIVDAAVTIVEAGGYEEMSIRSLAADLGVAPMSLYRHIRNKDDLLDEVVSRLLASAWPPTVTEDNWQDWIVDAAVKLRQFLVAQPAALHVYLRHPVVSPAGVERMDAMMDVLRRAGLDEAAARSAYGALHTYTVGFAALESSRSAWAPHSGDISRRAEQLAAYTTSGQFIDGLRYLLEGISRHVRSG